VLVDDVASTGRTLEEATLGLARFEPASISVLVTHALFVGDAQERLRRAGVSNIWTENSEKFVPCDDPCEVSLLPFRYSFMSPIEADQCNFSTP